jgi:hypothetical protein
MIEEETPVPLRAIRRGTFPDVAGYQLIGIRRFLSYKSFPNVILHP